MCVKYFKGNVYATFNEYFYHTFLSFLMTWKNSIISLGSQLAWNAEMLLKRNN